MKVRLNRLHFPVTALGPGRRLGLWVQGCSIGCTGCAARDTWAHDAGALVEIDAVIDFCRSLDGDIGGVTISGGEPFEQADALSVLLDGLHAWRSERGGQVDFLCYSGMSLARLERDFSEVVAKLDALIPEPFVHKLAANTRWRGSRNQPVKMLTELGRARYGAAADQDGMGEFQIAVDGGNVLLVGIPRAGRLERLEQACRERGVVLENVSWRA